MEMIGEERPSVRDESAVLAQVGYPRKEVLPITISPIDGAPLDPATDHVMEGAWRIEASVAWHEDILRKEVMTRKITLEPTSPTL